jgi:DTW domain-containing protein YfiP
MAQTNGTSDEEEHVNGFAGLDFDGVIEEFSRVASVSEVIDPPRKRDVCLRCCRPKVVCYCSSLPENLVLTSKLVILQHPSEEKRCLRTARMLELGCPEGHCTVIKGKKFTSYRMPELKTLFADENTIVLFPSTSAVKLDALPPNVPYNVILIDGTWSQARSMYHNSPELHKLTKVELNMGKISKYVIRTQPTEECLSTVETAALTLAHIEGDPSLYKALTAPLDKLCEFQLQRGALRHHSKEFLIVNGLYDQPVTRKIRKKLLGKLKTHTEVDTKKTL